MSKKITRIKLLLSSVLMFVMFSCTKTTTVLIDNSPAVTGTVSFSKDIVPILTKSCATTGCHSGSVAPNLSSTSAYNSLKSGNYISTGSPTTSLVYLWLTGKESATMPLGATNNPSNINALMLAWIKQGANNN
ncbi:MAG: hypothetical protein KGL19_07140 [Bacteroidota bacterium]|nr:hypothetical protein [Bacteroidota bacterium]